MFPRQEPQEGHPCHKPVTRTVGARSGCSRQMMNPAMSSPQAAQIRSNGRMAWQAATGYNQCQPDRNADRPLEERHRPQAQSPQLLQTDHGGQTRPESPEHNDRTRTACVRTHLLTLQLDAEFVRLCREPDHDTGHVTLPDFDTGRILSARREPVRAVVSHLSAVRVDAQNGHSGRAFE